MSIDEIEEWLEKIENLDLHTEKQVVDFLEKQIGYRSINRSGAREVLDLWKANR